MTEATYREICSELALDASSDERFSRDPSVQIVRFQGDSGSVWAPISESSAWGCRTCLSSSLLLLEQHYADFDRANLVESDATEVIFRMLDRHAIPVAVTDIYGPQCWSVCFPVPDCADCRDSPRQLTDWASAFRPVRVGASESGSADTGGRRASSSADFVSANRAAIGFASIVTNPYDGGDEPHATLIEGLVRTSIDPNECEVAGGKGRSLDQALASFLGEAIERYFVAGPFPAQVILGTESQLTAAINPAVEFGYPARDTTPGIEPYTAHLRIEWIPGENLTSGDDVLVPANLVFCPYVPRGEDASLFSVTSTTGVATAANVADATLQALLELIERDAFWYFARTGQGLATLPLEAVHPQVAQAVAAAGGRFTFHALPNPFDVPVVHVTYVTDDQHQTRTARGIGAGEDIRHASLRAFVECLQILHSLDLAVQVDAVDDDMRHIWFTGEAMSLLPNLFEDSVDADARPSRPLKASTLLDVPSLVDVLSRQSVNLYRVVLVDSPSFSVVRVIATGMCLTDANYFISSSRFADFSRSLLSAPTPLISYAGPTFM